jgi:alpha-glucosidase/alpha-D-xyloside xylohydrolase
MAKKIFRRDVLKGTGAACVAAMLPRGVKAFSAGASIAGQDAEIQIASVSARTVRISVLPVKDGKLATVPENGSLVRSSWGAPAAKWRSGVREESVKCGELTVKVATSPISFTIGSPDGNSIQQLTLDSDSGVVSFFTGDAPLLGFGEGGPQFDRRGMTDKMRSGQGGYQLPSHGGRVPIPWIIGTEGWAIYFHQPFGTFDFTGATAKFSPTAPDAALPLDIFVVASREPATIMAEYARITGHP